MERHCESSQVVEMAVAVGAPAWEMIENMRRV